MTCGTRCQLEQICIAKANDVLAGIGKQFTGKAGKVSVDAGKLFLMFIENGKVPREHTLVDFGELVGVVVE